MATTLGSLRNLLMTPSLAEVGFARRGFPVTETAATRRLEAIPQSVVCGFEWGIDARGLWDVERRLELVEPEMRGFAYEGAAMAFTIRDAMAFGRGTRTRELLRGPGQPHIFLAYIGIGFAMAKLPSPLWRNVVPDLTGVRYHPTMSWFAIDGLGFDRAYFHTRTWVDEQRVPPPFPFAGDAAYFPRAHDQGVGRALWFIHGGHVANVAAAVDQFATGRRADLWSGVGLAATFAGGCGASDLAQLRRAAGPYQPHVGQGAVFAAKARDFSGFCPEHTAVALHALAGLSVADAAVLADDVAVTASGGTGKPAYERWREAVRDRVTVAIGQSTSDRSMQ
jgi:hypothetical protein